MNIGSQVAYLRKHHNLSLRDLSQKTGGISIGYLSDIEHNRSNPSIDSLERIAAAFGMSVAVFTGGADLELSPDEHELINAYRANDYIGIMKLLVNKNSIIENER